MKSIFWGPSGLLLAGLLVGCHTSSERYASTLARQLSEIPAEQRADLQPYLTKADQILNLELKRSTLPAVDVNGRQLTSEDYAKSVSMLVDGDESWIVILYEVRVLTDGVGYPNGPMVWIDPISGKTRFAGGR